MHDSKNNGNFAQTQRMAKITMQGAAGGHGHFNTLSSKQALNGAMTLVNTVAFLQGRLGQSNQMDPDCSSEQLVYKGHCTFNPGMPGKDLTGPSWDGRCPSTQRMV